MKKSLAIALAAVLTLAAVPTTRAESAEGRGGIVGGLVGCCFGIRSAAAYNEGKSISVREWLDFFYVGRIWAAFEGFSGTTTSDLHAEEPRYF